MESMKKHRSIEDIQRLIINHPAKAYMEIGVDFSEAINSNAETMLMSIKGVWEGTVIIILNMSITGKCLIRAIRDMIFLAFYPFVKLYYIMGARKELLREHPEYRQPRR